MNPDRPEYDEESQYTAALPDNPTRECADGSCAMPRDLSKELGDYAEGHYAVAAKTKQAPTMEDSHFTEAIKEGL